MLRASKNPHPEVVDRLKIRVGQGITGPVAEHRQPVAVACNASRDAGFQFFNELPEDMYEAFLSVPIICRNKVVGVINLQDRQRHTYSQPGDPPDFDNRLSGRCGHRNGETRR